ncbi:MAG: His/Gly/Thr/Pro-type tRNA ligase C-terminal domain-containing protein, partial [Microcoleaceae cyanobacterium]
DTPATGFSYSLERLRQALHLANKLPAPQQAVNILVVPANTANQGNAIKIAETLRQNSFKVELDVKNQTVDANLAYAQQRQIPWLVTVNPQNSNNQEVNLINVTTGDRQNISVNDLIIYLKNLSN